MKKRASREGVSFNGKIKTEHSIVNGLFDILKNLSELKEIKSIIPGQIMRRGKSTKPEINLTIRTNSGWKAIGKCNGATQNFFIVTDDPDIVYNYIMKKD